MGTPVKEDMLELKLVQELAEGGRGSPPDRYIFREQHRPNCAAPAASDVPIIDLHRLLCDEDEALKLGSAVRSWGLFQIMSNGIFKSPVHRVVENSKERISVSMFYALDPEKVLEPAEGLVDETTPILYRKMKTKDFLVAFTQKFSEGETTIEWLRV